MSDGQLRNRFGATVTIGVLVFLFLPLAIVVLFSFHRTASLSFPFTGLSLRWFREVLGSAEFRSAAWNSLVVAVSVSALTLVLGTLAAYGLGRAPARLRGPLALLFFLPLTLPGLFIGISLLVVFARLDVTFSLLTVAAGHFVFVFPYFFLVARSALDRLDPALEDAAADLGASIWERFRRVTFPQVWPVIAGATSLAFALSFDEFVITFFLIGSDSTLPMFVWSGLRRTIDPSINTISTMLLALTFGAFTAGFVLAARAARRRGRGEAPLVFGADRSAPIDGRPGQGRQPAMEVTSSA
ncbi:MAG: ABC transporter permease [Actinobacteria bacterium]|nr:ABC transporter permease [Actinomycetota bacterium]